MGKEVRAIAKDRVWINDQIRANELRVISESGEQLGIMSREEAQELADKDDLDLVLISPKADPPVAKILDYGKYRYQQQKKEKENKKKQKMTQLKEIRLSVFIEDHDIETKAKTAAKFLQEGDKVKVGLRFRGREQAYISTGADVMHKFAEYVSDVAVIEKEPKMEGQRNMTMYLAPKADK